MNWNKIDLRKATIFDLTTDSQIIKQFWVPSIFCPTREDYIRESIEVGSISPANPLHIQMLFSFAELTNDKELEELINKTFAIELLTFSFE